MNKTSEQTAVLSGALLAVGIPIAMFLIVLWATFWSALAGWQLWQWFAIPIGAPDINGYHIAGLLMLAHLGLNNTPPEDKEQDTTIRIIKLLAKPPIVSALVVIAGFIIAKLAGLI